MRPAPLSTLRPASALRPPAGRLILLGAALVCTLAAGGVSASESRQSGARDAAPPSRVEAASLRHALEAEPTRTFLIRFWAWLAPDKSDEGGEPDPNPDKGN